VVYALKEHSPFGAAVAGSVDPPLASASQGPTICIIGTLESSDDIVFAGKLAGSIRCDGKITVLATAAMEADITAKSVILEGAVQGNIDVSDRIEIRSTGTLIGDVKCARLSIEDGAYFKGTIEILSRRRNIALAVVGSAEASQLDDLAEQEIASAAYEDLNEGSLFRRDGRPIPPPVIVESANYGAIRH
jgi:cytoskeletal protein CcmA (bactofilin family)